MSEVGRYCLVQLSCSCKETWKNQVAQDHEQGAFEDLQKGKFHNLTKQPVAVFHHLHSQEVFPEVQREPPVFRFVLIASFPVAKHY